MTDAERIAQSIEVWTGGHPAAALLRSQAAEIERLSMALRSAAYLIDANKLTCHHLHHSKKDFHEWDEPCGVELIAKQRLEAVSAALGNKHD